MFGLPLGFAAPWVLTALIALPLLWFLLRAMPPAPIRRKFPGVVLLLGLTDDDSAMERTPWWLMVLRMLLLACAIIGLAGPVLNPQSQEKLDQPMLVVMDGGWAAASDWREHSVMLTALLEEAGRQGRDAAMLRLTTPKEPKFLAAGAWASRVPEFEPKPWQPKPDEISAILPALQLQGFDTIWLSDGLDYDGRTELLEAFEAQGQVRIIQSPLPVLALNEVTLKDGVISVTAQSSQSGAGPQKVAIWGDDPNGALQELASGDLIFEIGSNTAQTSFSLPAELRARVAQFRLSNRSSAGSVFLTDDRIRRREVAVIATRQDREGLELLSPTHYLSQAFVETADLIEGSITDVLPANPDVIVMADIASTTASDEKALLEWASEGGLLLRFAGPQLAASDFGRTSEHPLMPVRLRAGGRTVGGAMSWGQPKALAPFAENSPFYGLPVPADLRVTAQVVAQPDPNLADRVLAELSDGTPLVTRKAIGQGQVVLFHVTANAEWSGLPLSGLFVQMLDRLAVLSAVGQTQDTVMDGTTWQPIEVLDGQGRLVDGQTFEGVDGAALKADPVGDALRPGLYQDGKRSFARNVMGVDDRLTPFAWPSRVAVQGLARPQVRELTAWFLTAAMILLIADTLASMVLAGRLRGFGLVGMAAFMLVSAPESHAQDAPSFALGDEIALAYVKTGDATLDEVSYTGLFGLSNVLFVRTSIEPVDPIGVNLETDELAFYPFLYWSISATQPVPSPNAYEKLNQYMRSGGMILFDTRDSDVAGLGAGSPNGRKLQLLAAGLDVPKLEPVPSDHVLTRTFYLLQDFPGRYRNRDVWVEAAPPDAEQAEGMPFRNLNDGVTPVVIGGNDWASAWATDRQGTHLFPVGRGVTGQRQRELSYRFGVNLIMHVLTGNYKSDQVHVPALLDRLGQ